MNDEKELGDRNHYHSSSSKNVNARTGASPDVTPTHGPPLTAVERRLAGSTSPVDKYGGGDMMEP